MGQVMIDKTHSTLQFAEALTEGLRTAFLVPTAQKVKRARQRIQIRQRQLNASMTKLPASRACQRLNYTSRKSYTG